MPEQPLNLDPSFGRINTEFDTSQNEVVSGTKIVISSQQRTGRKFITTIVNLRQDLDFEKILKHMKRTFKCNGTVVDDDEFGNVIQLQGDQREHAKEWLVVNHIARKDEITLKGA